MMENISRNQKLLKGIKKRQKRMEKSISDDVVSRMKTMESDMMNEFGKVIYQDTEYDLASF